MQSPCLNLDSSIDSPFLKEVKQSVKNYGYTDHVAEWWKSQEERAIIIK